MLKIVDKQGKTKYVLKDEDTEPNEILDNEEKDEDKCKHSQTGKRPSDNQ